MLKWPVYARQTPGELFGWWMEKHFAECVTHSRNTLLAQISLLERAGSSVPLGPLNQYAQEDESGDLELRNYRGADADVTLYEDEGINYNYEKGARSIITMHWDEKHQQLSRQALENHYGAGAEAEVTIHIAGEPSTTNRVAEYDGKAAQIKFSK